MQTVINQLNALNGGGSVSSTTGVPFSQVSLLVLNDNAANGTTTFLDQSTSAKTITRHNSAIYDNSTSPTGMTTSGKFVGGTADFITAADDVSLQMAASDFTIEGLIKADSDAVVAELFCKRLASETAAFTFFRNGDNTVVFYTTSNGSSWDIASAQLLGTLVVADSWSHFAVSRIGSNWYASLRGTQGSTWSSAATMQDAARALSIGANNDSSNPATVHFASVRVTKGTGRYSGNFTPPTLPFPTS